jgi:hypothetical protein
MSVEPRAVLGAWRRLGLWWVVAAVAATGLVTAGFGHIRSGGYLLSAACAVGALLRMSQPKGRAGGLAVRRRWVDVAMWLGLALALVITFALVRL